MRTEREHNTCNKAARKVRSILVQKAPLGAWYEDESGRLWVTQVA